MKKAIYTSMFLMLTSLTDVVGQTFDLYIGTTDEMNYSWANNTTVSTVTTDAPYEGADHKQFNYTLVSWWAGGAFNINDWSFGTKADFSTYTDLVVAYKTIGGNANDVLQFSFTDSNSVTGPYVTVASINSVYQIDTIPLSSFVGATALNLGNLHGLNWQIAGGAETSSGKFFIDNVQVIDKLALSTSDPLFSKLTISPNPSSGIYILNNLESYDSATLSDSKGTVISSSAISNSRVDLTSYQDGMYFLTIVSGNKSMVKKLMKN